MNKIDELLKSGNIVETVDEKNESFFKTKKSKSLLDFYVLLSQLRNENVNGQHQDHDEQLENLFMEAGYPDKLLKSVSKLSIFQVPERGSTEFDVSKAEELYESVQSKYKCFEEYSGYNALYVFFSALSTDSNEIEPELEDIAYSEDSEEFLMWMHMFLDVDFSHRDHFIGRDLERTSVLLDTIIQNMERWSGVKVSNQDGITLPEFGKDDDPEDFCFYKYCEYLAD